MKTLNYSFKSKETSYEVYLNLPGDERPTEEELQRTETDIVDKTFDEIDISEYDALAIPGGFEEFGFYEDAYDERFLNLIREFDSSNKYIASICVGALPVAASGVLKGRKATTYHLGDGRRQKQLEEFGAEVIPDQSVVIDKNIITSFCPETAPYVALNLLGMLMGEEKARVVAKAMGFSF